MVSRWAQEAPEDRVTEEFCEVHVEGDTGFIDVIKTL